MSYDGKVFRENYLKAIKKLSGCPTKKPTKDLLSLDFVVWMLDATKVKPQRVAVLAVLRPEGVLLLTKYSAKIQSLTRREFTQEVNDLGRVNFP